ncbi:MAG: hypothetical protein O3B84_08390 [Chloroflexi bacterium]|nr:hypothetical protein [Chloroflexota bacterium]
METLMGLASDICRALKQTVDGRAPRDIERKWNSSKQWTELILRGTLDQFARTRGYEVVYEWFRADQYWYRGMKPDGWDWDDEDSVAVEHENYPNLKNVLYSARKLCTLALPTKVLVNYSEPSALLAPMTALVEKREQINGTRYIVISGLKDVAGVRWEGFAGSMAWGHMSFHPVNRTG